MKARSLIFQLDFPLTDSDSEKYKQILDYFEKAFEEGKYIFGNFLEEFFKANETATAQTLCETFETLTDSKISALFKSGCLVKDSLSLRKMGDKSLKSVRLIMTPEEISKRLKTDLEKIKKIINK